MKHFTGLKERGGGTPQFFTCGFLNVIVSPGDICANDEERVRAL